MGQIDAEAVGDRQAGPLADDHDQLCGRPSARRCDRPARPEPRWRSPARRSSTSHRGPPTKAASRPAPWSVRARGDSPSARTTPMSAEPAGTGSRLAGSRPRSGRRRYSLRLLAWLATTAGSPMPTAATLAANAGTSSGIVDGVARGRVSRVEFQHPGGGQRVAGTSKTDAGLCGQPQSIPELVAPPGCSRSDLAGQRAQR